MPYHTYHTIQQDYFDVIKNPMDLSTVLKKLEAREYYSAQEAIDDYNQIWQNCFTYNTPGEVGTQCNAIQYNTIQYNTIQYNTIHRM